MKAKPLPQPPKWATSFLEYFVAEELIEEIQGDLFEAYQYRVKTRSIKYARNQYILDVFRFFKPYAFEKYSHAKQFLPMIDSYFKVALRNILKRKSFSLINLLGLSVGLTVISIIGVYLKHELTYDRHLPQADRTYRLMNQYREQVYTCMSFNDYYGSDQKTQLQVVNFLKDKAEVEQACHFSLSGTAPTNTSQFYVRFDERELIAEQILFTNTGQEFQQIFGLKFLLGNPTMAFGDYGKIILSESQTSRWFGSKWADRELIGKEIEIQGSKYELVGVVKDLPSNTHFDFNIILHLPTIPGWAAYTYFTLAENSEPSPLLGQLHQNLAQIYPRYLEDPLFKGFEAIPLKDIHFRLETLYELKPNGNRAYILSFASVALIILLIIIINYTNLSIAMYVERQKELGVRKVLGARGIDIGLQLSAESLLMALLAFPICLLALALLLPYFNELMDIRLEALSLFSLSNVLSLLALIVFTGLLSAAYPALKYGGSSMLRLFGKTPKVIQFGRLINFRNGLLSTQFVMVVGLLSLTYFIYQQMNLIQTQNLGYQKEGIIYFPLTGPEKYQALKSRLESIPEIQAIGANGVPGVDMFNQSTYKMLDTELTLSDGTDQYFSLGSIQTLGIDCPPCSLLQEGRKNIFLINQTAADKLAKSKGVPPQALIGEVLISEPEYENEESDYGYGFPHTIDGIIEDYKYFSLKYASQSLLINVSAKPEYVYEMLIRAESPNWPQLIRKIETAYKEVEVKTPFQYQFLSDRLAELYASERQAGILMGGLSLVAILLCLTGLAGVVSYLAFSRQKEMGIRKVLGASSLDILGVFQKEYLYLVGIATVIALPIALYFANRWLENFAIRIEPHFGIVLLAGMTALLLILTLVSLQSMKIIRSQPLIAINGEH
ncbi:MAG: FtsX-like permease family protein [Bacteroidota bacterium]